MAQELQDDIPVWEKRITRSRWSGKGTSVTESYNLHWEVVSIKWDNLNSYPLLKNLNTKVTLLIVLIVLIANREHM